MFSPHCYNSCCCTIVLPCKKKVFSGWRGCRMLVQCVVYSDACAGYGSQLESMVNTVHLLPQNPQLENEIFQYCLSVVCPYSYAGSDVYYLYEPTPATVITVLCPHHEICWAETSTQDVCTHTHTHTNTLTHMHNIKFNLHCVGYTEIPV